MKTKLIFRYLFATAMLTLTSCREQQQDNENETVIRDEKSTTTERGQRIGATKDSTTVDDQTGNPSNY